MLQAADRREHARAGRPGRGGAGPPRGARRRSCGRASRRRSRCRGRSRSAGSAPVNAQISAADGGGVGDAHVAGDQAAVARRRPGPGRPRCRPRRRRRAWSRRHRRGRRSCRRCRRRPGAAAGRGARSSGVRHADVDHGDARRRPAAAKALTTAPPARKFATICAVTSCGQGVTPWACTPWSPAKTATAAGSGSGGGHARAMPGEGDGEVLDAAERAARLGHAVEPVAGGRAGLGADGADGGGGVGDDVGGGHPESRPRRAADGQHDLRLASAAGRRPPGQRMHGLCQV